MGAHDNLYLLLGTGSNDMQMILSLVYDIGISLLTHLQM